MPNLPLPNVWEIHPMLVHFPIALLLTGVGADLFGRKNEVARRAAAGMLIGGVVIGWLAAGAGLLAYYTVPAHTEQAHTLMTWHLGLALAMLTLFTFLAAARWRRRSDAAGAGMMSVGLLASALLLVTGFLGGTIVYHGGAGVDPELLSNEIREGHHHGGEVGDGNGGSSSEAHGESTDAVHAQSGERHAPSHVDGGH